MSKVFKFNQHVCGEDYDRWKAYIESKGPAAIVLPDFIDMLKDSEEYDLEESEEDDR